MEVVFLPLPLFLPSESTFLFMEGEVGAGGGQNRNISLTNQ